MMKFIAIILLLSGPAFATDYAKFIPDCKKDGEILKFREIEIDDLNGDGKNEKIIACETTCGAHSCQYVLLISKNEGYINGGIYFGGTPRKMEEEKNKMPILTVFDNAGCAGTEGTVHFLEFSKDKYIEVKKTNCECDLGVSPPKNRPPECP